MLSSRGRTIAYWVTTALLFLPMGAGGVADILQPEEVAATLSHLGYPAYFGVLLGTFKLAGMAVLLAPGLRLLKEWAYAGIFIDLIAALVSHLAVDGLTGEAVPPVVFLVIAVASWWLRPDNRRLAALQTAST